MPLDPKREQDIEVVVPKMWVESEGRFMKQFWRRSAVLLVLLGSVLTTIQCSDDPLAPFEPEVTNATDSFQLQATGVTNQTATLTYSWTNTGTQAKVDHSTTTISGTASVAIQDAAGATVYDKKLVPSLNDTTNAGTSGTWTIRLVLNRYSGTLNFRVQKP